MMRHPGQGDHPRELGKRTTPVMVQGIEVMVIKPGGERTKVVV